MAEAEQPIPSGSVGVAEAEPAGEPTAPGPMLAAVSPRPSRFTTLLLRVMMVAGIVMAATGALYIVLATPSPRVKVVGLACLTLGAALFGAAASGRFLRRCFPPAQLDRFVLTAIYRPGPPRIAAGVGTIAFITLVLRLWIGSTAAIDLMLWWVAIEAFAMPMVKQPRRWKLSRQHLAEVAAVSAITIILIAVNAVDANHWYYSAIGDEYGFLAVTNSIFADGLRNPFAQEGVYSEFPMMGAVFQAAVMAVVGRDHFGWVLSSILSFALAIPAVYLLGRTLAGPAAGLIAAALFGFNHYTWAFAHIGYHNIMSPTLMVWPIALYVLAMRRPGPGLLFAAGIAGGLGFYTYYSSRAAMPILALFLLSQYHWRTFLTIDFWRDQIVKHLTLVLGFVLGAGPIFAASGAAVITQMFKEVPGGYSAEITGPPGERIWTNLWMNGPAVFYNTHVAHYISGPLLDPLTGALTALGIGLAIRHHRHPGMRLLLIWVVVASAATGLLSPHRATAITRLHVVIPPLALLGALGARQIWDAIPGSTLSLARHRASLAAVGALLAVVLGLNLYRFWVETPPKLHLSQSAVAIGALRSPLCDSGPSRGIVLIHAQGLLQGALTSYRPASESPRFIDYGQLRPGQPIALDAARCIVFGDPNEESVRHAIDDLRRAHPSGQLTPFKDYAGIGTVLVFTPGPVAPRR